MTEPWHADREEVFVVMRQIQDAVDHAWQRSRDLQPRYGHLGVGSEDFDYTLKATVGEAYLRALQKGGTPVDAFAAAETDGKDAIQKWNTNGCRSRVVIGGMHSQLHRDNCAAESIALGFHSRFSRWGKKTAEEPNVAVAAPVATSVRFRSATTTGQGYCGPTCLSALTGLDTKQVAAAVRQHFNLKAVRGLTMSQMKWFIEHVGYRFDVRSSPSLTLGDWSRKSTAGVFLIELANHWLLASSAKIVCTQFNGVVTSVSESKYLSDSIEAIYEISGHPNEAIIKSLAQHKRPTTASKQQMELFV